jgi:hypothetical protein
MLQKYFAIACIYLYQSLIFDLDEMIQNGEKYRFYPVLTSLLPLDYHEILRTYVYLAEIYECEQFFPSNSLNWKVIC